MKKEIDLLCEQMTCVKMFEIVPKRKAKDYFKSPTLEYTSDPSEPSNSSPSNISSESSQQHNNTDMLSDNQDDLTGMQEFEDNIEIPAEFQHEVDAQLDREKEQEIEKTGKVMIVISFSKFSNLCEEGKRKKLRYYIDKIMQLNSHSKILLRNLLLLHGTQVTSIDAAVQHLVEKRWNIDAGTTNFHMLCSTLKLPFPSSIKINYFTFNLLILILLFYFI